MTNRPLLLAALAAATLTIASPAAAWLAQNGYVVQSRGNGQFEVRPKGGLSDANAWCAAGDFASRQLGAGNAPVYRISPPPRPRGQGIVFSMSPAGAASSTGLMTVGGAGGGSKSASSAQNLCNTLRPDRMRR